MRRLLRNRYLWCAAFVIAWLGGVAGWAAWHYRVCSWHDYQVLGYMERECHPVWRDFHFRRIKAGADLDEVIKATKPAHIEVYGDFTSLVYQVGFTGVTATAYKGRLVSASAWSCCWKVRWFNILSPEEMKLFDEQYNIVMRPILERWEREAAEERANQAKAEPENINDPER